MFQTHLYGRGARVDHEDGARGQGSVVLLYQGGFALRSALRLTEGGASELLSGGAGVEGEDLGLGGVGGSFRKRESD